MVQLMLIFVLVYCSSILYGKNAACYTALEMKSVCGPVNSGTDINFLLENLLQ